MTYGRIHSKMAAVLETNRKHFVSPFVFFHSSVLLSSLEDDVIAVARLVFWPPSFSVEYQSFAVDVAGVGRGAQGDRAVTRLDPVGRSEVGDSVGMGTKLS